MNRRELLALSLPVLGFSAVVPLPAFGQADYPSRPIKLVVPFSPGGVVDVIARLWL